MSMKPKNVSSVLLVGPLSSNKSSFLLQGAVHYAEQGFSVVYISARGVERLPPPIHCLPTPGPDVFCLIRFLYLPRWQDLLQHLFSLHLHSHVPKVLIVEALDHYCMTNSADNGGASEASHAALICASLLDATSVCAQHHKAQAYLLVALNQEESLTKLNRVVDIFFTDTVWLFEKKFADTKSGDNAPNKEIVISKLDIPGTQMQKVQLEFTRQPGDGAMVLDRVMLLCKK